MNEDVTTRISKYLSYVLRHNPADAGLELQDGGWVANDLLIEGVRKKFPEFDEALLQDIVRTDAKRRYSLEAGRVRVQQGHSVAVGEIGKVSTPPDTLFHGTTSKNWASIQEYCAIKPMGRNHVHLSADIETALTVASRRRNSKNVVLRVDAKAMSVQGYRFEISGNGVWLTDCVPIEFLKILDAEDR